MSGPSIYASPIPTGGVIALTISGAVSGTATLSRSVSGVSGSTLLYSGSPPPQFYLDLGDQLPAPLASGSFYQYTYTDNTGSGVSAYVQPLSTLTLQQEPLTQILIRVLQGAILNFSPLPPGIKIAEVTHAMPLGGSIPLPLIVINLDLVQQTSIPIGQSVAPLSAQITGGGTGSGFTLTGFVKRMYRISVLSANAPERDFYRDNLTAALQTIYGSVLQPLGVDVTHKWQASSGQVSSDKQGKAPGFYFAEIMLEFEGTLNVVINPTYGLINTISTTISGETCGGTLPSIDVIDVPVA